MKQTQLPDLLEGATTAGAAEWRPRNSDKAIRGQPLKGVCSHKLAGTNAATRRIVVGRARKKHRCDGDNSGSEDDLLRVHFTRRVVAPNVRVQTPLVGLD